MSASANVFITKKRGRDEVDERQVDSRSFTIKVDLLEPCWRCSRLTILQPDATDPFAASRTFTPICLLSRAQLPLSYLDPSSSGSRLFTAHVDTLESAHDHDDDATVLVATETKAKELYAVERVKRRVYVLCRLGKWVKEGDIVARSKRTLKDESQCKRQCIQPMENGKPWWTAASADVPQQPPGTDTAMVSLKMKPHPQERTEALLPVCDDQWPAPNTQTSAVEGFTPETTAQTAPEIMQELSKQYLEALYLSRTSLAYFTKGPLSRTRAAFSGMSDLASTRELVDFLRESILTSSTMDKKYRDSIPSTVKELVPDGLVSPDHPKKSKRKRKWKAKRDKYGFFTDEKDVVERWWLEHDDPQASLGSAETMDTALKRRLPKLRSRETFLQLILLLETLALEASLPPANGPTADSRPQSAIDTQAGDTQQEETQADASEKKSKPKKKQDLAAVLEILLDKLCIWHSLDSHSPVKRDGRDMDGRGEQSDELKSFCIEVVVPFYSSRIPQYASAVNKKLGGPSAPTPVKRKTAAGRKPGEPAIRQAPEKKPRKPLARVGTDILERHSRGMPSLNRSATDTDALSSYIKRETSEVSMESIPAAHLQRKPRQSLVHTLDSSRRQVDLNAMSQANDAKLQRKQEMQDKMQSAINMLRKPNRAAALAEVRDQTDVSFAKVTAAAKGRSNAAASKARTGQRPQITATPSLARAVKATPHKRAAGAREAQHFHSSGTTEVPSSSAHLAQVYDNVASSSFAIPQTGHRPRHAAAGASGVEETPSRGFARFMPPGLARPPGTLDSPTVSRKIAATPSKPVRSLSLAVEATPIRDNALVDASPNVRRREAGGVKDGQASTSIYDSLGWEEEYEDLV